MPRESGFGRVGTVFYLSASTRASTNAYIGKTLPTVPPASVGPAHSRARWSDMTLRCRRPARIRPDHPGSLVQIEDATIIDPAVVLVPAR